MQQRLTSAFAATFGRAPDVIARAPGRVNLIGEHTDYNDGFVLPCAVDFQTLVAAARRTDNQVRVVAADQQFQTDEFDLAAPLVPDPVRTWPNYIRGVLVAMQAMGFEPGGADLAVAGNVPQGAGLSSSASLEVATAQALNSLFNLGIPASDLARIGQLAENDFVGCSCGIMDQMISVAGVSGHALLLDCRSLATTPVPMPAGASLLIINSHKQRGLVDSAYNERRQQCELAARSLEVDALRDATLDQLNAAAGAMDPTVFKRARHVITENDRTRRMASALGRADFGLISQLMSDSHVSMKNDFEITVPEIDILVNLVASVIGNAGGVRMTGGGFGGCVVALVPGSLEADVLQAVSSGYESATGLTETVYRCQPTAGAGLLPI
ncbi:MAG: galactokinase [Proteobacteria bacterium]|nr:galactokinase [Pseudomonadota bacterium]